MGIGIEPPRRRFNFVWPLYAVQLIGQYVGMRGPGALRVGAHVRIVAPASPVAPEKLRAGIGLLEVEGYRVTLGKHVLDADCFLAGCDEDRAIDLREAFDDASVDFVYCARGGYGCARLMPLLDLDQMAGSGKLFAGFSDITTLHLALNRRGLATLYAPMALTFVRPRKPWVIESFTSAIKGGNPIPRQAPKGKTLAPGVGEGITTGGCLCLLCDSLCTPDALETEGRIVLIEDVDEQPHRIDAMLTHLILANKLQKAAGIVVGEMTRTDRRYDSSIGRKPWREIVRERLEPLGVPTITEFPFGHAQNMLSLPLGIRARLDASAGTLTYLESLCEA